MTLLHSLFPKPFGSAYTCVTPFSDSKNIPCLTKSSLFSFALPALQCVVGLFSSVARANSSGILRASLLSLEFGGNLISQITKMQGKNLNTVLVLNCQGFFPQCFFPALCHASKQVCKTIKSENAADARGPKAYLTQTIEQG